MAYGTLKADVIQSDTAGTPPQFNDGNGTQTGTLCRAWVNFVGSTAVIRASFNVSSISRTGTGQYTVNFTNALADANYAVSGTSSTDGSTNGFLLAPGTTGRATTSVSVVSYSIAGSAYDGQAVSVSVFR